MRTFSLRLAAVCASCALVATAQQPPASSGSTNLYASWAAAVLSGAPWTAETNGLKFGVAVGSAGRAPQDRFWVSTFLCNGAITNRYGLFQPSHGQCLELTLAKKGGRAVARTRTGDSLCQPVGKRLRSAGRPMFLPSQAPEPFDAPFDLLPCFRIKEPGAYALTVRPRVYVLKTYPDLAPLDLPAIQIDVTFSDAELEPRASGLTP